MASFNKSHHRGFFLWMWRGVLAAGEELKNEGGHIYCICCGQVGVNVSLAF